MTTVAPVLVARTIGRANSSERMREMARCWSMATESPNHAMLLTLSRIVGAVASFLKLAPISSPNKSS